MHCQVEEKLYKVSRYLLERESVFFKDMFSLPKSQDTDAEGLSVECPIVLLGTTKAEMDALVQCLHWGYALPRPYLILSNYPPGWCMLTYSCSQGAR